MATAVILNFGFACSPPLKPSIRLLVYLQQKMVLGSDVSLDFTQVPIPNPPLISCCHPTPSLAQAGCKYISNLHHSCSVMTRAIKNRIHECKSLPSSPFCPRPEVLGLFFSPLLFPGKCDEGGWSGSGYVQIFRQSLSNKWISVSSIICLAVAPIICCEL